MEIIKIKDLTFSYPDTEKKVLDKINININEGEFILLIGESGCGKSTLLRQLKNEIQPYGKVFGEILYKGKNIRELDQRKSASEIGFVMQNPDYQIVTDKVWHELAFGLESLGIDSQTIRRRASEMASFFGIQTWFRKDVSELSGGQKQLLNLAAIMCMQPDILILDEPTSQLDPIVATEFLETVYKINRELGVTVILTEHRLEEVFSMADKVILMDDGKVIGSKNANEIGDIIYNNGNKHSMFYSLPTPIKVYKECDGVGQSPLTIKEGREWVKKTFNKKNTILKAVSSDLKENNKKDSFNRDYRNLISYVPQGNTLFSGTIEDNLRYGNFEATEEEIYEALKNACALDFVNELEGGIETVIGEKATGISEGQAQRLAIARSFLRKKPILILDEATSALDPETEVSVLKSVKSLPHKPTCIIITHRPSALNICHRIIRLEKGHLKQVSKESILEVAIELV